MFWIYDHPVRIIIVSGRSGGPGWAGGVPWSRADFEFQVDPGRFVHPRGS